MKTLLLFLFVALAVPAFGQGKYYRPAIGFTNSLDDGVLECNTQGQSFMTVNGISSSPGDYTATTFVADGQGICAMSLNFAKHASETSDFYLQIYSNGPTNSPATLLATSATVLNSSVGTTTNHVWFTLPSTLTPASGSTNHAVLRKVSSTGFAITLGRASGGANLIQASSDGVNWVIVSSTRQMNYDTRKP